MSWDSHIFTTQASLEQKVNKLYEYLPTTSYNFDDKISLVKELLKLKVEEEFTDVDSITNLEKLNNVSEYWVLAEIFFDNSAGNESDNYDKYLVFDKRYRDMLTTSIKLLESSDNETGNNFIISQGRLVR